MIFSAMGAKICVSPTCSNTIQEQRKQIKGDLIVLQRVVLDRRGVLGLLALTGSNAFTTMR